MAVNYAYKYVIIRENGLCTGEQDTSNFILDRLFVPVQNLEEDYLLKYYWPIPDEVNSWDDFQGLFYYDAEHTRPFEAGNANLI